MTDTKEPTTDPRASGQVMIGDKRPAIFAGVDSLLRDLKDPQHQLQVATALTAMTAARVIDALALMDRGRRSKLTKLIEDDFSKSLRKALATHAATRAARATPPAANDDVNPAVTTPPEAAGQ